MQMKRLNAVYKINYGVSLPHLKEIAHEVIFSPEECDKLWTTNIREAMLVACIQLPDAEASKMVEWTKLVATVDMAELASFLLFYRTHELTAFCEALVKRNNPYDFTIAVHSAARALQHSLPATDAANVICDAIMQRTEFSLSEVRGIAMLINRLNIDGQTAPLAKKVVDYLTNINTDDAQKILFSVE